MKKSILSIMIAFSMFFQTTAHAYTASSEVTNETVKDVIADEITNEAVRDIIARSITEDEITNETVRDIITYITENPKKFPSKTVVVAEFLQNKNIELSQTELNQLNTLVQEKKNETALIRDVKITIGSIVTILVVLFLGFIVGS